METQDTYYGTLPPSTVDCRGGLTYLPLVDVVEWGPVNPRTLVCL